MDIIDLKKSKMLYLKHITRNQNLYITCFFLNIYIYIYVLVLSNNVLGTGWCWRGWNGHFNLYISRKLSCRAVHVRHGMVVTTSTTKPVLRIHMQWA